MGNPILGAEARFGGNARLQCVNTSFIVLFAILEITRTTGKENTYMYIHKYDAKSY